jgi:hypothetical protein
MDQTTQSSLNQDATLLENLAFFHEQFLGVLDSSISSGSGGNPQDFNPSLTVKRPWLEEPEGSLSYDEYSSVDLPNPPPLGPTTIVQFTVPDGLDGVINAYSWNFQGGGFGEGSGDIVVQILRDGAPVRNYDHITVERGTTGHPRKISPIRIFSKQIISMTVNHVANPLLNGLVVGSFLGYFYPSRG